MNWNKYKTHRRTLNIWSQNRHFFSASELDKSIRNFLVPDTILLDIETTGLSASRHFIYCIGCSYLSSDKEDIITIRLFFAENPEQEPELLTALAKLLDTHKTIITFNGNAFDLPFLKNGMQPTTWSIHFRHSLCRSIPGSLPSEETDPSAGL